MSVQSEWFVSEDSLTVAYVCGECGMTIGYFDKVWHDDPKEARAEEEALMAALEEIHLCEAAWFAAA